MDTYNYYSGNTHLHTRTYERFILNTNAYITHSNKKRDLVIVRDASVKGAGVFSSSPMDFMERVNVVMGKPFFDDNTVCSARVVWVRKASPNLWQSGLYFSSPVSFE